MTKVLITGGTGLTGTKLIVKLQERGHEVAILSRSEKRSAAYPVYRWDPATQELDPQALDGVDCIVHLAGVNIGGGRWTRKRKQRIIESRVDSAQLIFDRLKERRDTLPLAFISASAIGYYGAVSSSHLFSESDPPATDFLGKTCELWEQAAIRFEKAGIRSVRIRTGVALSGQGGILSRLSTPVKIGLGAAIGKGSQYLPWIHMDDLCDIYIHAIENERISGAYNAVAPEHITNREFMQTLSGALNKPYWLPNIPVFMLRLIFGEMSVMLLEGSRVSSEKIVSSGFRFRYPVLQGALKDIYS